MTEDGTPAPLAGIGYSNVCTHVPVEATRKALDDLAEGVAGEPEDEVDERPAHGAG